MTSTAVPCLLAVLVGAAGCNTIFGLGATEQEPMDPTPDAPPDGPSPRVGLSYLVGATKVPATMPASPERAAIAGDPGVKVGPLQGALTAARYVPDDGGEVEVPPALFGSPWRLEYTPPGDVTHEVQWNPAVGAGQLAVPIFGRLARVAAPAGSGYRITPTPNHSFTAGRVFTTGIWLEIDTGVTGSAVDVNLANATPRSGPPGAPELAARDLVLLVDYGGSSADSSCQVMTGSSDFEARALTAGALTSVSPSWTATSTQIKIGYEGLDDLSVPTRLAQALGTRSTTQTARRNVYGRIASVEMPAFTQLYNGVPAPMMMPLADCPFKAGDTEAFVDPIALGGFPAVVFSYTANLRQLGSSSLLSSIATVTRTPLAVSFDVPIPTGPITLGSLDLADVDDQQLPLGGFAELSFGLDRSLISSTLHHVEVRLHRISGAQLVTERVYLVSAATRPTVAIDTTILVPSSTYVFSLHTFRGRPGAATDDFTTSSFPQSTATVYTRPFVTP